MTGIPPEILNALLSQAPLLAVVIWFVLKRDESWQAFLRDVQTRADASIAELSKQQGILSAQIADQTREIANLAAVIGRQRPAAKERKSESGPVH